MQENSCSYVRYSSYKQSFPSYFPLSNLNLKKIKINQTTKIAAFLVTMNLLCLKQLQKHQVTVSLALESPSINVKGMSPQKTSYQ